VYVDPEVHAGRWRLMMATVPFLRVVMIVIIIMRFIAAREREGCYAYEQSYT